MTYFDKAYEIVMNIEGGYVNDPDDMGGETYKGISRRWHPSWPVWDQIDAMKSESDFPGCLDVNEDLQELTKEFYKIFYWDLWWGDEVAELEPDIAYEMFDISVNQGVHRAVSFLQTSLNVFNRNELLYPDLVVDGQFGVKTYGALASYLTKDNPDFLITALNVLQGNHYIEYMTQSPIQEKNARGWFNRVQINKA